MTTKFRVSPVMTTSIRFHILSQICERNYYSIKLCKKQVFLQKRLQNFIVFIRHYLYSIEKHANVCYNVENQTKRGTSNALI